MKWFVPSFSGDFRLEATGKKRCLLTVVKPTAREVQVLESLMEKGRELGWTTETGAPMDGAEVLFNAPSSEVGKELVQLYLPLDRTITAVKHTDGTLEVQSGDGSWEVVSKAEKKDPGAKAVSTKRATPSCPECIPGSVEPATEVLLEFLTPEQHRDWSRHRAITVEGGTTGHRYVLAHRHSQRAQVQGRIAYDADDDAVIHFYDWSVPPEEEVLGAKLVLEHRESWLRNEATCLGTPATKVMKNPFGGYMDGVETARLMTMIGAGLAANLAGGLAAGAVGHVPLP